MNAVITGENDERVGVNLRDKNGVEHVFEMEFDGEIKYHEQDGYPNDPAERTKAKTERLHQARRFAKWHVYRELGYDTVTPYENPDRIVAAIRTLLDLPDVKLQHYFGELQDQLRRHHDGEPVDLPFENVDADDIVVYRQDIWLEPDPTEPEPPLLEQFCDYVSEPMDTLEEIFGDGPDPRDSLPSCEIEAVSDVHYLHSDGLSNQEYQGEQPPDREPDVRLELLPVDVSEFDSFGTFLASHLVHQVRDCFVEMGVEPPEPFQRQGLGKHDSMVKQQLMGIYEPYFQASTPVQSWDPGPA